MPPTTTSPLAETASSSNELAAEELSLSPAADSRHKRAASVDSAQPSRYHDMDSLRAAMMLLGLVFHAAWFFVPTYYGNTLGDVSGSWGYSYFFGWVHQFRMQTFFLLAGFFACLLVRKRGMWSFAKNRGLRIVLPLLLGMLTLWPLMKLQYLRGGLISGRILSDDSLFTQYRNSLASVKWESEWLVHLWFLYTLIVLYTICWLLRLAFDLVLDRQGKLRTALERATNSITQSHFGAFLFAVPVAICMAIDLSWFGIYAGDLKPMWLGVAAYWVFFSVGWCLFSKPEIINRFVSRWPAYVTAGSILSLLLCGYFHTLLTNGRAHWGYPAITETEMNYPSLQSKLLAASGSPDSNRNLAFVWNALSPTYQDFVREHSNRTPDQLAGFSLELSMATVFNDDFPGSVDQQSAAPGLLTSERAASSSNAANPQLVQAGNRELLARILDGDVTPFYTPPMWSRIGYFYTYCLATWLLVFGMLGLFRRWMSHPSPTARYLADSSYWLFLIHLPIQFEFSLYFAQWEANSLFKFLVYNLVTFAITLPTYHYFVRSTWLGALLNGRMYPMTQPKYWLPKFVKPKSSLIDIESFKS